MLLRQTNDMVAGGFFQANHRNIGVAKTVMDFYIQKGISFVPG
jgi:hypothetical protein